LKLQTWASLQTCSKPCKSSPTPCKSTPWERLPAAIGHTVLRADGERSPSWLATLRFTSVEHLPVRPQHETVTDRCHPPPRPTRYSVCPFGVQAGVGVLVCEALRERSEQRSYRASRIASALLTSNAPGASTLTCVATPSSTTIAKRCPRVPMPKADASNSSPRAFA